MWDFPPITFARPRRDKNLNGLVKTIVRNNFAGTSLLSHASNEFWICTLSPRDLCLSMLGLNPTQIRWWWREALGLLCCCLQMLYLSPLSFSSADPCPETRTTWTCWRLNEINWGRRKTRFPQQVEKTSPLALEVTAQSEVRSPSWASGEGRYFQPLLPINLESWGKTIGHTCYSTDGRWQQVFCTIPQGLIEKSA